MFEQLLEAVDTKQITSIYSDRNDSTRFSVGVIQIITSNEVLIESISEFGDYDGYIMKKYGDIFFIEQNDKYIAKVRKLYIEKNTSHKKIANNSDEISNSLLEFALKNNLLVCIQLVDSGYTDIQGFIATLDANCITISAVDEYGFKNGNSVCYIEDISKIICDDSSLVAVKILYQINYNKTNN